MYRIAVDGREQFGPFKTEDEAMEKADELEEGGIQPECIEIRHEEEKDV